MEIKSKNYFNKELKLNKNYVIKVVKNNTDITEMIRYFNNFIKIKSNKKFAGLDFEFNSSPEGKKIALFQINLEIEKNDGKIYLFYPLDLNKKQTSVLIELSTDNQLTLSIKKRIEK